MAGHSVMVATVRFQFYARNPIVLMSCDGGELKVRYNKDWGNHIYEVRTKIDGVQDHYHWKALKHGQRKTICGNDIEFHRYHAGINVRVVQMKNTNISGAFNDSRCANMKP